MGNAESSLHLRGLPVDVIALQVTPMLDIKDFVALDTAGAMASSGALQEAQSLMQPIELPYTLNRSVGVWLLKHG
jgi:tRNA (Thr-GGU) A37 N-methylase